MDYIDYVEVTKENEDRIMVHLKHPKHILSVVCAGDKKEMEFFRKQGYLTLQELRFAAVTIFTLDLYKLANK